MVPEVGSAAPAFSLAGRDGGQVTLADHAGRVVVLYFYPKDDTPGCTQQARDFNALTSEFAKADAVVIGISPDSPKRHGNFARKYGLDLTLGSDPDAEVLRAYGVWGEKSMFGRKYMGVIRTTFLIDGSGRIARVWENVKVPGHALEVLEAARALNR
jgi:peroxiredoxin Q/BCP